MPLCFDSQGHRKFYCFIMEYQWITFSMDKLFSQTLCDLFIVTAVVL